MKLQPYSQLPIIFGSNLLAVKIWLTSHRGIFTYTFTIETNQMQVNPPYIDPRIQKDQDFFRVPISSSDQASLNSSTKKARQNDADCSVHLSSVAVPGTNGTHTQNKSPNSWINPVASMGEEVVFTGQNFVPMFGKKTISNL